jgi:AP-1 complex subunit beta-1
MTAYFSTSRRGEIPELQDELNSFKSEVKREAIKKVIAAMTVGKDVSSLFPHVVKCMETTSMELKKLVYLYIINYAKTQPELAVMAVNSFRKDARQQSNALLRALAVRTLGCIRLECITEYVCEPLADALIDDDPYVRKTAAVCVAKLYEVAPGYVEDHDILSRLTDLVNDGNAMVVANAVAAIAEISDIRGSPLITLTGSLIGKILAALPECFEWGQIFIVDFVSSYTPVDSKEAEGIVERVMPLLAHNNPAVILTAAKVVLRYMDFVTSTDVIRTMSRKLAPSLVSLLSSEYEIQYVALRNISLVVQKRPNLLERDVRIFFCKYNDPVYIKIEKLEIILRLVDIRSVDVVLNELKEYATEVDPDFVRKAVQTIGRCAVKLERAADRCVRALQELIQLRIGPILQEVVIVMRDIFRRYPNRYEMIIKDIFNNLDDLDDAESRASFIWIVGEYAERIDDADSQLGRYVESFVDEPSAVQFQVLTATVKLFLKKPEETEELITSLLKVATEECSNPDLRDRALIYWKILSSDPQATKEVVMCQRPPVSQDSCELDPSLLDKLIEQIATVASVYHKPAEGYVAAHHSPLEVQSPDDYSHSVALSGDTYHSREDEQDYAEDVTTEPDLIGTDAVQEPIPARVPLQIVLTRDTQSNDDNSGLQIEMAFQRTAQQIDLEAKFTNLSAKPIGNWAMQFNVNPFGLQMAEPLTLPDLQPNSSKSGVVRVKSGVSPTVDDPDVPFCVQIAVRSSLGVHYFQTPCMFTALLTPQGRFDRDEFRLTWQSISDPNEICHTIGQVHPEFQSVERVRQRLEANSIFIVAQRSVQETGEEVMYCSSMAVNGSALLTEVRLSSPVNRLTISVRTNAKALVPLFVQAVNFLLSTTL